MSYAGWTPPEMLEPSIHDDGALESAEEYAFILGRQDGREGIFDVGQVPVELAQEYRKGYEAGQRVAGRGAA